jgi:hypothetical protein
MINLIVLFEHIFVQFLTVYLDFIALRNTREYIQQLYNCFIACVKKSHIGCEMTWICVYK